VDKEILVFFDELSYKNGCLLNRIKYLFQLMLFLLFLLSGKGKKIGN